MLGNTTGSTDVLITSGVHTSTYNQLTKCSTRMIATLTRHLESFASSATAALGQLHDQYQ